MVNGEKGETMSTTSKGIATILLTILMTMMLSATAFAGTISSKDALKIALDNAGLSKSQVSHLDTDAGKKVIEVEFTCKSNKADYEYKIAKNGGKILSKDVEYAYKHNASKAKIGKKAALKKVAKFSGIKYSVVKKAKCTYEYDDHEGEYKVKFKYKGWKYKYELLAPNGTIMEWGKKRSN